ncbi:MAG: hypothetical protein JW931_05830 [Methanomicrobiaceae archaeon]|nr:hypothetical protein [Methanomicrobiaceae archaeon]
MEKNMEDRNRKMVLTAIFGIAAVIIALFVVYISTGGLSAVAVVWGLMIIALLSALTAVKTGRKKEYNYAGVAIGALMVVAGLMISAMSYFDSGTTAGSGMVTGGTILLVICLLSLKKSPDRDIRDERSLKIGTWAIAYSWYLTFFVVIVIFWLSYLDIVVIEAYAAIGTLVLLMPLSTVGFQWYFSRKGDVY